MGIARDGAAKAYVVGDCPPSFDDTLGGTRIEVRCDRPSRSAYVVDAEGRELPTVQAYWFAWAAFHPGTKIVELRAGK